MVRFCTPTPGLELNRKLDRDPQRHTTDFNTSELPDMSRGDAGPSGRLRSGARRLAAASSSLTEIRLSPAGPGGL